MEYIELTFWTIIPFILAYVLYRFKMPDDIVIVFMLIGFIVGIYWILITSAIVMHGIKKYIEIRDFELFVKSIRGIK